jgi:fumarate reductase flavoprotein subunit
MTISGSGKGMERRDFFKLVGVTAAVGAASAALSGCGNKSTSTSGDALVGWSDIDFTYDVDVLVVGAGASGLMAAYGAANAGKNVLAIDKQLSYGGDAANSACTLMVSYSDYCAQKRPDEAVTLDTQLAKMDTYYPNDTQTATVWKAWYTYAAKTFDLWAESWNVSFMDGITGPYKGIFYPAGGIGQGAALFATVYNKAQAAGAKFVFSMKADTFIVDSNDALVGLRCYSSDDEKWVDIKFKSVVLCTGGFASNQEMMAKYYSDWTSIGCVTTQALGEGIKLGQTAGGALSQYMGGTVNMNAHTEVTFVPQMFSRSFCMLPNGKRFYSETAVHNAATSCISAGSFEWWAIFDDAMYNGPHAKKVQSGAADIKTGNSIEELAENAGIPVSVLQSAFDDYNAICEKGVDSDFGRTLFLEKLQPPYYAYLNRPVRYKTSGGLWIDENSRVLDESGSPVSGLFAAGCTGGTTDIIVAAGSGLLAGESAAASL